MTAHSAAWMFGVRLADTHDPVTVGCPPNIHIKGVRGVTTHRTLVVASDLTVRRGVHLTPPVRCAWDIATLSEPGSAVPYLDPLAHAGVLDLTHLEERVALSQGMWRVTRVREAVRHLAWPDMRVAVEYDGIHHADPMQMRRDRRRLKLWYRLAGLSSTQRPGIFDNPTY